MRVYACSGGLYEEEFVQKRIERADEVEESGIKLSGTLHSSGRDDISVMAMQRLNDQYVYTVRGGIVRNLVAWKLINFKLYILFDTPHLRARLPQSVAH